MKPERRHLIRRRLRTSVRNLTLLHRRVGLVSALFVLLLSVTGIALHHSDTLGLDSRFIASGPLLSYYQLEAPELAASYAVGERRLSRIENRLYLDSQQLPGSYSELVGALGAEFGFVAASATELVLFTGDGELIEVLASQHGVPGGLRRLGMASGVVVLESAAGGYTADLDSLQFSPRTDLQGVTWSESSAAPEALATSIKANYGGGLLSWERLMLDIHSGRLLGGFGALLVDIMALLFIFMAATGVWIWSRRRSR